MPTLFEHFFPKKEKQNPAPRHTLSAPGQGSHGWVSDMTELYRTIRAMGEGPELEKSKADFEARWGKLDEKRREILVQKLLEVQLLPEIVGKALKIFKGTMIRLV